MKTLLSLPWTSATITGYFATIFVNSPHHSVAPTPTLALSIHHQHRVSMNIAITSAWLPPKLYNSNSCLKYITLVVRSHREVAPTLIVVAELGNYVELVKRMYLLKSPTPI